MIALPVNTKLLAELRNLSSEYAKSKAKVLVKVSNSTQTELYSPIYRTSSND